MPKENVTPELPKYRINTDKVVEMINAKNPEGRLTTKRSLAQKVGRTTDSLTKISIQAPDIVSVLLAFCELAGCAPKDICEEIVIEQTPSK